MTTSSRLLTNKKALARELSVSPASISLLSLHQLKTEEQFAKQVRFFLDGCGDYAGDAFEMQYLLVQSDMGFEEQGQNLIECAR